MPTTVLQEQLQREVEEYQKDFQNYSSVSTPGLPFNSLQDSPRTLSRILEAHWPKSLKASTTWPAPKELEWVKGLDSYAVAGQVAQKIFSLQESLL